MKKNSIQAKRQRSKRCNITPLNVSTMRGDDEPNKDVINEIHIGGQVGMPEEIKKKETKIKKKNKRPIPLNGIDLLKKRITFADFRKQSEELKYG